ncbi:hypothetical protein RI367_000080 [Sorochytrium milnesiophthora]
MAPLKSLTERDVGSLVKLFTPAESEQNWRDFDRALKDVTTLVKTDNCSREEITTFLHQLKSPIARCIQSDRSQLSGSAMDLVDTLARTLQLALTQFMDALVPPLIKATGKASKLTATRAYNALTSVATHIPTVPLLVRLCEAGASSNKYTRTCAVECIEVVLDNLADHHGQLTAHKEVLENLLLKTVQDPAADTRESSRRAITRYLELMPSRQIFLDRLPEASRKYFHATAAATAPRPVVPTRSRTVPSPVPSPAPSPVPAHEPSVVTVTLPPQSVLVELGASHATPSLPSSSSTMTPHLFASLPTQDTPSAATASAAEPASARKHMFIPDSWHASSSANSSHVNNSNSTSVNSTSTASHIMQLLPTANNLSSRQDAHGNPTNSSGARAGAGATMATIDMMLRQVRIPSMPSAAPAPTRPLVRAPLQPSPPVPPPAPPSAPPAQPTTQMLSKQPQQHRPPRPQQQQAGPSRPPRSTTPTDASAKPVAVKTGVRPPTARMIPRPVVKTTTKRTTSSQSLRADRTAPFVKAALPLPTKRAFAPKSKLPAKNVAPAAAATAPAAETTAPSNRDQS